VFVKEPIILKIASVLAILSLSFVASQYLGFFTVDAQLNSTEIINNQTTISQTESNPITPFTIPRDEPSESNGLQSTSTTGSSNNGQTQSSNDLVLLSQRYNNERFGDEIVGEILNNGTITAEFAKVSVSFYDENGAILGSEFTYADPSTISPGQRAAFTIFITSDTIEDDTETYEFTLQWQDSDSNDFSKRITGEPAQTTDNDDSSNTNDNNVSNNRISAIGGDLDCSDVSARNFQVGSSDPNNFDGDNDGIGCESSNNSNDDNGSNDINSRCPDGFHRSPSGDCERVTDTSGMERCSDGYHRSPDGDCERVNNNDNDDDQNNNDNDDNDNNNNDNNNDDNDGNNDNDENNNDDNVMDDVEDTIRESGIDSE
jgi:hypothetical protein